MSTKWNVVFAYAVAMLGMNLPAPAMLAQGDPVKYIYSIDCPMGTKPEYLEWVKTVVITLQAPEEVQSNASYGQYLTSYANRRIEYEFANAMDVASRASNQLSS